MCPPCKIILDKPVLGAAAMLLADTTEDKRIAAAARHLAAIAIASASAIIHGVATNALTTQQIDEAHAWSELECHRAAHIRRSVTGHTDDGPILSMPLLMKWAEETRLHTTKLIGGEYRGAWTVLGITGIARNE